MKYLLIIFCLLFTFVGCSKKIDSDDLVKKNELYYEKFTDVPFTGEVTGQKQGKISRGRREGKWVEYYESGHISEKANYKDGIPEGESLEYYENGQLKSKINYKDRKQEGEWLWYYENGQLEFKNNYKDGKLIKT